MDTVAAAENLSIEMKADAWRLLYSDLRGSLELLSVGPDGVLRYPAVFADTRRLPAGGTLAGSHVDHVLLGWSPGDQAWHLGLLLTPPLAALRDSRWCELAHWPDPDQEDFRDLAERSGQSLSAVTGRPFRLIEPDAPESPDVEREPVFEESAPDPEEVPLPRLPLNFSNDWVLETGTGGMLQLVRSPAVARRTVRRVLWYAFWALVFVFLIVGNHFGGIAQPARPLNLPHPLTLPLLAGLSTLVLLALIVRNLIGHRNSPDILVFDSYQRQLRARHGGRVLWSKRAGQIQSIYVTELLRKQRRAAAAPFHAELNLHLSSNRYQHLLQSREPRQISREPVATEAGVSELRSWHCSTNTQAVALHVAQSLELPVWLDRRKV